MHHMSLLVDPGYSLMATCHPTSQQYGGDRERPYT